MRMYRVFLLSLCLFAIGCDMTNAGGDGSAIQSVAGDPVTQPNVLRPRT